MDVEAFPSVVCPVVKKLPVTVRPVEDARRRDVCPETVSDVAEAEASTVCPETVSAVEEARPRVVFPVTERVPVTVSFPVIVEVPTVEVLAVRYVVTAFVVVELPMMMLVMFASVATRDEKNPLVEVADVEYKFVAVRLVADAVESVV